MKVVQIEGFIMKEDDTDLMTEEFMKKFLPLIEVGYLVAVLAI